MNTVSRVFGRIALIAILVFALASKAQCDGFESVNTYLMAKGAVIAKGLSKVKYTKSALIGMLNDFPGQRIWLKAVFKGAPRTSKPVSLTYFLESRSNFGGTEWTNAVYVAGLDYTRAKIEEGTEAKPGRIITIPGLAKGWKARFYEEPSTLFDGTQRVLTFTKN